MDTNIVSCVCLLIEFATPSRLLMFKCYQWQAVRKDDYNSDKKRNIVGSDYGHF